MKKDADRRDAVDRIRRENEKGFGPPARAAVKKLLAASLSRSWMYVYELTQNALDAGAQRVCWRAEGDTVTFQHDGPAELDESHVRGLSSLGASTKGLDAVGFMGVGFKSVFARYRGASVSGFGWRFRFEVGVSHGDLESEVAEWFDTLLPRWDDGIPDPDVGYTTAFLLDRPTNRERPVVEDLERIASTEDPTPLAVLARRGLTELRIDDVVWNLSVEDGIVTVLRSGSDTPRRWKVFVAAYRPEDNAMKRFLEVRQETHDQVDKQGQRVEREVVGLLPLDENGLPQPPGHGRVYATLPTEARVPFGFHLQADWFVDVARQNLRDVDGDPWQEAIVGQVPEIVRQLLVWLSGESDAVRKHGYSALCKPGDDDSLLATPFRDLRDDLARTLADQRIVPVHGSGIRRFCVPAQAAFLPEPLDADFKPPWRPDLLFGLHVMDEHILGKRATGFARWLEWGKEIDDTDVKWKDALPRWWRALPEDERPAALFTLWRGAGENGWNDAPIIPTKAGTWAPARATIWLNEPPPTRRKPSESAVAEALAAFLPSPDQQLQSGLRSHVREAPYDAGVRWLKERHNEVKLAELVHKAAADSHQLPLVELLQWALHKRSRRTDLVPLVLTEEGPRVPAEALVADPLVPGGRDRRLLFDEPALVAAYADIDDQPSVVQFLQDLGVRGAGALVEREEKVWRHFRHRVETLLRIDESQVESANDAGYSVKDYTLPFEIDNVPPRALQDWLSHEYDAFRGKGRRSAYSFYRHARVTRGRAPTKWVRDLQSHPWLLCEDGERRRPAEVLLQADPDCEDAPIAVVNEDLAALLKAEGVDFGGKVQKSPVLRRLERRGATEMAEAELAELLREAIEVVETGEATKDDLGRALDAVHLRGAPLASRVVRRTGAGTGSRGDLGGWVVALSGIDAELAKALTDVTAVTNGPEIPATTTGRQALDFLLDLWKRSPARVEELRGHLAAAYRYVLDDVAEKRLPVAAWNDAREHARLYGDRAWHPVGPTLVVDDVQSPLIRKCLSTDKIAVVSAHLGGDSAQVQRVAQALDVALLSDEVDVEQGTRIVEPSWGGRLRQLTATIAQLEDRPSLDDVMFHDTLSLRVGGRSHPLQAYVSDATLMLVGAPSDFAVEAAEQLVDYFKLGQRGQVVPRLTIALSTVHDEDAFLQHLELLADGLGVSPTALPDNAGAVTATEASPDDSDARTPVAHERTPGQGTASDGENEPGVTTQTKPPDGSVRSTRSSGDGDPVRTDPVRRPQSRQPRGSRTAFSSRDRRAADHYRVMAVARAKDEAAPSTETSAGKGIRDDFTARQAVIHYERHHGRKAEAMEDLNPGFDLRSSDGSGCERRIEVKGVQRFFEENASVVLSARQARDAIRNVEEKAEEGVEYWLYVVDSTETDRPRVFPIPWTRSHTRLRYGFHAYAWRDAAEKPAEVTAEGLYRISIASP